jgi:hypothetical protein
VLQLVNTPDIYEENKYQRRNLLFYHYLLETGLRKFNVSEHQCTHGLSTFSRIVKSMSWLKYDPIQQ